MRIKLRELRKSQEYTQQEFASLIGIERSTYANIELGNKNPSFPVSLKIKEVLNYQGDDIFLASDVSQGNNLLATT